MLLALGAGAGHLHCFGKGFPGQIAGFRVQSRSFITGRAPMGVNTDFCRWGWKEGGRGTSYVVYPCFELLTTMLSSRCELYVPSPTTCRQQLICQSRPLKPQRSRTPTSPQDEPGLSELGCHPPRAGTEGH